jgi:hypothetical protein
MLDIQAIRRALADSIRVGITRTPNVYAYLPDSPVLPCIAITADEPFVSYAQTMGAAGECDLRVLVRICTASRAEDSLIFLDDMLSVGSASTSSVVDAILADRTLDGIVEMCLPGAARIVADGEQNAGQFEAVIPVEIWAKAD